MLRCWQRLSPVSPADQSGEATIEFIPIKLSVFHHDIPDTLFPQAAPVFGDATALDTAIDMLDPQPTAVQRLVGHLLRQRQLLAVWFLGRHEELTWGSVNARKPSSCKSRLPVGKG
jgi:hypothetical protein